MSLKPLIIVAGEPYSIFSEIFLKLYNKKLKKLKTPIILIISKKLFKKQITFERNRKLNEFSRQYFKKIAINQQIE